MNVSTGTPLANTTGAAVERVVKLLLDEVSNAYVQGDAQFLDALNMPAAAAQAIGRVDRRLLARLVTKREDILNIRFDQGALSRILSETSYTTNLERQRRELINAGATHTMLNELGFLIAREGGSQREAISGLCKTHPQGFPAGRPPTIDADMIRSLTEYWASIRNPGRINPIDHLLRTADHLDIRVASIWNYIQSYPGGRQRPPTPPGTPDWIMLIFPAWPHQQRVVGTRVRS